MIAIETLVAKRTWALTRDGEQGVSESGTKVRPPLDCEMILSHPMELVVQLAERWFVSPDVAGSSPVFLPTLHIYCSSGASQSQGAARLTGRCM